MSVYGHSITSFESSGPRSTVTILQLGCTFLSCLLCPAFLFYIGICTRRALTRVVGPSADEADINAYFMLVDPWRRQLRFSSEKLYHRLLFSIRQTEPRDGR